MYNINEVFLSVQGEGSLSGVPSLFVRFAGCNCKCPWCDTDHTAKYRINELTFVEWLDKTILKKSIRHVVLTGGEPLIQNIDPIVELINEGYSTVSVQIETNGTFVYPDDECMITVSPKTPDYALRSGEELKLVYTGVEDLEEYMDRSDFTYYYLQPCWKNGTANFKETYKKVMEMRERGWRLSLQTHKLINVK